MKKICNVFVMVMQKLIQNWQAKTLKTKQACKID